MKEFDAGAFRVFHSGMKRIALWFLALTFAVCAVRGQDAATQQQIDKLSGQMQDLLEAQAQQGKRMDALMKDISELREKVTAPQVSDSASREDLKKLAEQVQEIDKKRQDDRELILKNLEKLGKIAAAPAHVSTPVKPKQGDDAPVQAVPQNGYEYTIKAGDSPSAIAKAYRDQGVKVTTAQILKANPGLDANKLFVGKKIFIPDPNAK